MDGILNEITNTIHKREVGSAHLETVCGATYHVAEDHLCRTGLDSQTNSATKCGRCFEDGGGY